MNRKHILINSEKLNIRNWAKWSILFLIYVLSMFAISLIEDLISKTQHIPLANICVVTFYIRGFIALSLIHDLALRFNKTISILWSLYLAFMYLFYDSHAGDKLYLGTLLFMVVTITFNIFIYNT